METSHKTRRGFLKSALASSAALVMPNPLSAQSGGAFTFEPDGQVSVGGRAVPVDIALLGPNGEPTAGFYAALDPFHGQPFSAGWRAVYDHYMHNGPLSTDEHDIDHIVTHVTIHGITRQDLEEVYRQAKKVWDENPHLRTNSDQRSDLNFGDDTAPSSDIA